MKGGSEVIGISLLVIGLIGCIAAVYFILKPDPELQVHIVNSMVFALPRTLIFGILSYGYEVESQYHKVPLSLARASESKFKVHMMYGDWNQCIQLLT